MKSELGSIQDFILIATGWIRDASITDEPIWEWLHVISHLISFCIFTTIPILLIYFLRKRRDFPHTTVCILIAVVIFLNGLVQLLDAMIVWFPLYKFSAIVKAAGAVTGWMATLSIFPLVPTILNMPFPKTLEKQVNDRTAQLNEAKQSLEVKDQRLTLSLAIGRMGTWEFDILNGTILLDSSAVELLGIGNVDQVISIEKFIQLLHPDDRNRIERSLRTAIKTGEQFQHTFQVLTVEKGYRWFESRGVAVADSRGEINGIVGVHIDITEQRLSDEKHRLATRAVENTTSGIMIMDARQQNAPMTYVNPAFEALTGYTAEEAIGRDCFLLLGAETSSESKETLKEAIQKKQECQVTLLNYRKDGSTFWNNLLLSPIENELGVITHFVGVQNDISDRVDYENRLIEAQQAAESANDSKSQFLANMSHEIRTPLTAILGCADSLCQDLIGESSRETAKTIRSQGELLLGILNDILDLSKIEAGKLEIHKERCEIVEIITSVRDLMETYAAEKNIVFDVDYQDPLPEFLETDPLRFRQILLNLCTNAIKFTPDQGHVTVSVSLVPWNGAPHLEVAVTDDGVGIPPDQLKNIFEAFTQLGRNSHQRFAGTGLGLTILRHLLSMLGGDISVSSELGQGSKFSFFLPVESQNLFSAEELQDRKVEKDSQMAMDIFVPARVLIAEDTRAIQFMLNRYLENCVSEVVIVNNGREALDKVLEDIQIGKKFDIILMDMQMPVVDGYEATKELRRLEIDVPVVALTAGAMAGDKTRCFEVGCTDYLSKPVSRSQLLLVIHQLCSTSSASSRSI